MLNISLAASTARQMEIKVKYPSIQQKPAALK